MVIGNSEGMGVSIVLIFKRKYEGKLEIPGGGRVQTKEPSLGEVWIFFGTTPCGTKPAKKLDTLTKPGVKFIVCDNNYVNSRLFHYFYMFLLKQFFLS